MKTIECVQGELSWHLARWGVPSASQFDRIVTPTGKLSSKSDDYIAELIGDLAMKAIYPEGPPWGFQTYMNQQMKWGVETEAEARSWYEMFSCSSVEQVGFVMTDDDHFGCSPDGLCGEHGGLELKCPSAKTQVQYLLAETLPDAYRCQVHGSMIVTGREWWDFVSYCQGLPPFVLRVHPDAFTTLLAKALHQFYDQFQATLEKVRGMQ